MPSRLQRLLVLSLVTTGLLVLPQHATADTSYHKLKKHLRTAERVSGVVLEKTGEGLGIVLLGVAAAFLAAEDADDDQPAASTSSATTPPRSTSSSSAAKPSTPPAKSTRPEKP
jgi:hypothetical protein